MTVTLVTGPTVGTDPAATNAEFFRFMARDPSRIAQVLDKRMFRCTVTSTDATPGAFLVLTTVTLDPAAGAVTFDAGTARCLKFKAIGKTSGATTNVEYFEQSILVIGAATPVPVNGTPTYVADNNSVAGAITATAGVGTLTLLLTGKAASAITWTIDCQVDDAVPVA